MDSRQDIFFAHQVLGTLFAITNKAQAHGDKYIKELSIRQMELVGAIVHLPEGEATLNNIASFMGTSKQSVKHIVDALEKKNHVKVVPNERDKRALNVEFTPIGWEIMKTCAERNNEFIEDVFKEFSRDELETLLTLLKKLYRFDGIEQESFEEKLHRFGKHEHRNLNKLSEED